MARFAVVIVQTRGAGIRVGPGMEMRQLRYVVLLAETLHFGRAAEHAYISQPAFSQQIARLERELGTRLFDRSSNRVSLTPAGELLVERAVELLGRLHGIEVEVRDLAEGPVRSLRVGVFADGVAELTPLVFAGYRRAFPDVSLTFTELSMTSQLEALTSDQVDVALLRGPIDDEQIELDVLLSEPRVAVLPDQHPLAEAPSLSVLDLIDEPFVAAAAGAPEGWGAFWRCDDERGEPARVVARMSSVVEGLATVAHLGAVDTCPAGTARHYPYPGVTYVPLCDAGPTSAAVAHRRADERPAVSAFCALASEVARQHVDLVPLAAAPEGGG
jgi:DNA-binding transcriptional LysR family regulator